MLLQKQNYFLFFFRLVPFDFLGLFFVLPPTVEVPTTNFSGVTGIVLVWVDSAPITVDFIFSTKPDISGTEKNDLLDESFAAELSAVESFADDGLVGIFLTGCVDSDPVTSDFIFSTEPDISGTEKNDLPDDSYGGVTAFGDGFITSPVVSAMVAYVNTKEVIPIKTYDMKGIWSVFILKL